MVSETEIGIMKPVQAGKIICPQADQLGGATGELFRAGKMAAAHQPGKVSLGRRGFIMPISVSEAVGVRSTMEQEATGLETTL